MHKRIDSYAVLGPLNDNYRRSSLAAAKHRAAGPVLRWDAADGRMARQRRLNRPRIARHLSAYDWTTTTCRLTAKRTSQLSSSMTIIGATTSA